MIWNDGMLHNWATRGGLTPYNGNLKNKGTTLQPASVDLELGDWIRLPNPEMFGQVVTMDTDPTWLWTKPIQIGAGYDVLPGGVCLCHSRQYVTMPHNAAGFLQSRSGTGRRIFEHMHSGYFEPSFHGEATFEFYNPAPWVMRIKPGDRLVQLVLMTMEKVPERSYSITGKYNGQTGPTPHKTDEYLPLTADQLASARQIASNAGVTTEEAIDSFGKLSEELERRRQ